MLSADSAIWRASDARARRADHRLAFTVAGVFVVSGLLWVLLTDVFLYQIVDDPVLLGRLETAKGWTFVGLAALLIYAVTLRSVHRASRANATTSAVLDSIADGVLLLGEDRTIQRANAAAQRMLRCTDLVGMNANDFARRFRVSYPDGSVVPPEQFISQRVFDETGPLRYRSVLYPPGGPKLVIAATAAPVHEAAGAPVKMVVSVMHDITAAEHLERSLDQFLASAAHTLKTPVAIIKANAQILEAADGTQLSRASAAIERQCAKVDHLLQNLLVLARVRSNTLQLYPELLELGPLVERVCREMGGTAPPGRVVCELAASPRMHADRERMSLAVRNLITEAARRSSAEAQVRVRVGRVGRDASVTIAYHPQSPTEELVSELPEYDELGICRLVAETVIGAHGGMTWDEEADAEHSICFVVAAVDAEPAPQ